MLGEDEKPGVDAASGQLLPLTLSEDWDRRLSSNKATSYALLISIAAGVLYISIAVGSMGGVVPLELIEFLAIFFGLFLAKKSYSNISSSIEKMFDLADGARKSQLIAVKECIVLGERRFYVRAVSLLATFFLVPPLTNEGFTVLGAPEGYRDVFAYFVIILRIYLICDLYYTYMKVNAGVLRAISDVDKRKYDEVYDRVVISSAAFLTEENSPTHAAYIVLLLFIFLTNLYELIIFYLPSTDYMLESHPLGDGASLALLNFAGGAAAFHMALSALKFFQVSSQPTDITEKTISMYYNVIRDLRRGSALEEGGKRENAPRDANIGDDDSAADVMKRDLRAMCVEALDISKVGLQASLQYATIFAVVVVVTFRFLVAG